MDVRTVTGSSIQAALTKARAEFGDGVVLIESTPASGDRPARISIMLDESTPETTGARDSRPRVPKPPEDGSLVDTGSTVGNSRAGGSQAGYGAGGDPPAERGRSAGDSSNGSGWRRDVDDLMIDQKQTGRGAVFPSSRSTEQDVDPSASDPERVVENRLSLLRNRLGGTGTEMGDREVERWVAHPFFAKLLDEGMRPRTVTRLFGELTQRGFDPETAESDDLHWGFAQLVCRRIEIASNEETGRPLVVVGPGGAGKTSLVVKLASHLGFHDRDAAMVIHVLPEDDRGTAYQPPTDLYRRVGLPVQNVRTRTDMKTAVKRAQGFNQVFVDTPPVPFPLDKGDSVLRRFNKLLQPLGSIETHFVLNASYAFDGMDTDIFGRLPLEPDRVALTHLDHIAGWGRLVEWLLGLPCPVEFVTDGRRIADSVRLFTREWLVKEQMEL